MEVPAYYSICHLILMIDIGTTTKKLLCNNNFSIKTCHPERSLTIL